MGIRFTLLLAAVGLAFGGFTLDAVAAAAEIPPEQLEFFETKIRPILVDSCYKCHSDEAGKSKGSLTLDTREALRKGGASGEAIVPGDPDKSLLIEAVRYANEDLRMPPEKDGGGKLAPEKIAALEQWIRLGAPDPRNSAAPSPALDWAKARGHWAFQSVARPSLPAVKNSRWVRTPVDTFILARLEAKRLSPARPADKPTLLRRVTYDLIGLPPTPEEMDAFLRDRASDAYARVVDRLLASPRHGERWGRFWLDVARYADTQGYLVGNAERRFAFSHTYRDYVIRAFNDDKPYDQFVVEQLAADRLPLGEDKSALAAMGFLTLGRRFLGNQNDIIDDRIDVVTRGLMGLTVSCARCHDHKFDPIPTRDYYGLHGVFASSEEPAEKPLLAPLVDSPAYQDFLRKTADLKEKVKAREAEEVKKFLTGVRSRTGDYLLGVHDAARLPPGGKLEAFAGGRKLNFELLQRWQLLIKRQLPAPDPVFAPWLALAALREESFATEAAKVIAGWRENGEPAKPRNAAVVRAFTAAPKPPASLKEVAATYNRIFAEVEKAWQAALGEAARTGGPPPAALPHADEEALRQVLYADNAPANPAFADVARMLRRQIDGKIAGLRREIEALNWTEPGAPLRAMALVDKTEPRNSPVLLRGNPANRGPEVPRHFPAILAGERSPPFSNGSGRLELARQIASAKNPLTARVFVNRVWGWHFGPALVRTPSDFGVRTEAPVHRELLDWLAAEFADHGWSVKHLHRLIVLSSAYQQSSDETPTTAAADPDNQLIHRFNRRRLEFEAVRDTLLAISGQLDLKPGGLSDDLAKEPFTRRRTVYGFVDRQNLPGMFRTFDYPNPDATSAQRFATTVPQQALFLMNSPFAMEQARQLAGRSEIKSARTDSDRIRSLYRLMYQRAPDTDELKLAQTFLRAPVTERPPVVAGGWQYGRGAFDSAASRVRDFQPMTLRQEGRVTPAREFPDATFGHLSLTATGGHPGTTPNQASIRRWTAPADGVVQIKASLAHASPQGDGVRGRIVSSRRGSLGEWTVHNQKTETNLDAIEVMAGENLDFVVDGLASAAFDGYTWAPRINFTSAGQMAVRTWNAEKDFTTPPRVPVPLTRWEELAQVLLLSNELAFVD